MKIKNIISKNIILLEIKKVFCISHQVRYRIPNFIYVVDMWPEVGNVRFPFCLKHIICGLDRRVNGICV